MTRAGIRTLIIVAVFLAGIQPAYASYFVVLGEVDGDIIISDGSSSFKVNYSYDCYSSSFNAGDTIYIDSYYPGYGDTIVTSGFVGEEICEIFGSQSLNLKPYFVIKVLDSSDTILAEDKFGTQYLVEYGIGCLSMWRYEGKNIYIDVGGGFLNAISDQIYLFDSEDSCKVWDAEEIGGTSTYTPTPSYTPRPPAPICPKNSTYESGSCSCNDGYFADADANKCVRATTKNCQSRFGNKSHASGDSCYCDVGYELNSRKDKCIKATVITPPQTTAVPPPQVSIPAVASSSFTRDLQVGSIGDDVKALQSFLNTHGFAVASVGTGSPGNETTTFGNATKAALAKFQTANGISPAAGFFGSKTRAIVNGM